MTPNVAGLVAYLFGFVGGILMLVIEPFKNDRFVRFHAFQSIFFNVAVVVVFIAWFILTGILGALTGGLLALIMLPLTLLIYLGVLIYWIFLMVKAYNNERHMIPIIGELAAKQAG